MSFGKALWDEAYKKGYSDAIDKTRKAVDKICNSASEYNFLIKELGLKVHEEIPQSKKTRR